MLALGLTAVLYGVSTVLVWPADPRARLLIIPCVIALLALRPRVHQALVVGSLNKVLSRVLVGFLAVLVTARLIQFGVRMSRPIGFMEDIAGTYLESILAILKGLNPYAEPVDPTGIETGAQYLGFKYPPLQLAFYAVGLKLAGLKGYLATNGLAYFGLGALLMRWLSRHTRLHAVVGGLMYFAADHLCTMVCVNGVNDVFPTIFLVLAVMSIEQQATASSPRLAGVLTGVSALCKQFPAAALYGIFLVLGRWKSLFWAGFVFSAGMIGFVLWDPMALLHNVFEFQMLRPIRSTSLLSQIPEEWRKWVTLTCAAGALVSIIVLRARPLWDALTISLILLILAAKLSPPNFFVWVTPFLILAALDLGPKGRSAA